MKAKNYEENKEKKNIPGYFYSLGLGLQLPKQKQIPSKIQTNTWVNLPDRDAQTPATFFVGPGSEICEILYTLTRLTPNSALFPTLQEPHWFGARPG